MSSHAAKKTASLELIAAPAIEKRIFVARGRQAMLDEDLADLYGVETKRLLEQVKRNIERFPADFMFQLDEAEAATLRSQNATSKPGRGGRRYAPYVFTEQGVARDHREARPARRAACSTEAPGRFQGARGWPIETSLCSALIRLRSPWFKCRPVRPTVLLGPKILHFTGQVFCPIDDLWVAGQEHGALGGIERNREAVGESHWVGGLQIRCSSHRRYTGEMLGDPRTKLLEHAVRFVFAVVGAC